VLKIHIHTRVSTPPKPMASAFPHLLRAWHLPELIPS
jgi:hypothetical protein